MCSYSQLAEVGQIFGYESYINAICMASPNAVTVRLEGNFTLRSREDAALLYACAGYVLLKSVGVWLMKDLQVWQEAAFEHSYAPLIKWRWLYCLQ